jgi:outer membrane biosynthesis protein TonB
MAVDVDKLIADAKKAQAAARTAAAKAQAQASKDKVDAETQARSKSQTDYANTLKPRLEQYESELGIWARKIARGDKLSPVEKKEFDRLVKDYNSLNKTVDAAIKKSNDILVEARKKAAASSPTPTPNRGGAPTGPTGPTSPTPTQTPDTGLTPTPTPKPKPGAPKPTPKPTPGAPTPTPTPEDREATALGAASTTTDLALPETLFKNIPSLNAILKKFVNTPGMTEAAFLKLVRDDVWFKQNSKEIKNRYVQYYNYRDLQASGRAQGTTAYEMEIAKIEAKLKKRAVEIGSAAANDPAALRQAAENLYITNRSEDETFITDFLAASVKTMAGMIGGKVTQGYSGEALANYDKLVEAARDNGFQVSDILPGASTEQQVIQGIISGNIDVNRVISDARKLAAQGQPEYVRDLLAQGYTLKQVFAPYRQVMANVLEIGDANQIDLNDPLLRSAITDKGDMNLYDFRKQLRQDSRWQYTAQAKEDVSTAALGVLRDFGFQG